MNFAAASAALWATFLETVLRASRPVFLTVSNNSFQYLLNWFLAKVKNPYYLNYFLFLVPFPLIKLLNYSISNLLCLVFQNVVLFLNIIVTSPNYTICFQKHQTDWCNIYQIDIKFIGSKSIYYLRHLLILIIYQVVSY